jgi:hypothetical protein
MVGHQLPLEQAALAVQFHQATISSLLTQVVLAVQRLTLTTMEEVVVVRVQVQTQQAVQVKQTQLPQVEQVEQEQTEEMVEQAETIPPVVWLVQHRAEVVEEQGEQTTPQVQAPGVRYYLSGTPPPMSPPRQSYRP